MKKLPFLLFVTLITMTTLTAQTHQARIEVVGKAIVKEIPNEIVFRIPLKIVDSTYLGCNERLTFTLNELQKDLKSKGISEESIHTANYSISENMVFEEGKRKHKGYKGSVNVMLSADYAPELIHKVLKSVNTFKLSYNINFAMSEEQKTRLTKVAMINAVEDANQKAKILTESANVQLGSILNMSYGIEQFRPEPFLSERIMSSQVDDASSNQLNLSPPLTSIHKSVKIVWGIK